MIKPTLSMAVPMVCLLGCFRYEVIEVDTVAGWCDYMQGFGVEQGEYWPLPIKFEVDLDASRDDYVSTLNATHLEKTQNRMARLAWREKTTLHLLNVAAVSDIDADAFTEKWQSKIAAAKRQELDEQEDVCLYRGIATLFDNVVIHTPRTDSVQPGASADEIVIIPTERGSA